MFHIRYTNLNCKLKKAEKDDVSMEEIANVHNVTRLTIFQVCRAAK